MTGSTGRASGRGPLVVLDHVLVPVLDLGAGAAHFRQEYGLDAQPGGRHPGVGTANYLVPLGSTYIELIAVVDEGEAATLPRSQRVLTAARAGRPFATWAVRSDSLDELRAHLLAEGWALPAVQPGARRRPDGVLLEWRSQELVPAGEASVLPFVIEWRVPPGAHPAEAPAEHPSRAGDIVLVRFTAPDPAGASARLRALVGDAIAFEVAAGERAELVQVELEAPGGRIPIP